MKWTRIRVGLLVAALALGAGSMVAAPAQAADLGTITVTGAGTPYSYSPTVLSGAVGDTFRVVNATTGGATLEVGTGSGDTGEVSVGSQVCNPLGAQATCIASSGAGTTYTITSLGTVTLRSQPGGSVGQIRLQAPGGASTDPRVVYPFLTLNPNGGTCTGPLEFNAIPGTGNDSVTLPTSGTCTRSNYTLAGWAFNADGSGTVLPPGLTVATGSTTLYAVWRPSGVQVTYDANVGMSTQCLAGGANVTSAADRRSTSVVQPGSNTATAAPCTPVDSRLAGWAYTGNGSVAITAGQPFPATLTSGSTVTLFAKWETVYGVTASPSPIVVTAPNPSTPGKSKATTVTLTATVNGQPAAGRQVSSTTRGPVVIRAVSTVTNADGQVTVSVGGTKAGSGSLDVSFGDKTVSFPITIEPYCALGSRGPGGGLIFLESGGKCYEMAPNTWSGGTEDPQPALYSIARCGGSLVAEAEKSTIGTGAANTKALRDACPGGAADLVAKYNGGGTKDWFIPSEEELRALMRFAKANPKSVPASFALGPDAYWSSSRSDAGHYFLVLVTSDPSATYGANPENVNRFQLRPIRAF